MAKPLKTTVTIKALSQQLGVPISTVGNILRGDDRYSEDLRKVVMKAAKASGYKRNILASGLRGGKTNTVGILWSFGGYDSGELITRLSVGCYARDYTTLITESLTNVALIQEKLADFRARHVDAVVMQWGMAKALPEHLIEQLKEFESVVIVSPEPIGFECNNVVLSVRKGIHAMVDELVANGSRNPAILINMSANMHKVNAWRERFAEHGIKIKDTSFMNIPGMSHETMKCKRYEEAMETAYGKKKVAFDSLFCGVDEGALAAINWLKNKGIRVPEDVLVCGYNNTEFATVCSPQLSSLGRPNQVLIDEIISMLFDETEKNSGFRTVVVDYQYFPRTSTNRNHLLS